ncbi:hypothetical protein E8E14_001510 [Neopestalotiopsis sp. 37M]|nr:hypothetical protein E8E14_001510 [Neopestalotiopsis sp. 37M]
MKRIIFTRSEGGAESDDEGWLYDGSLTPRSPQQQQQPDDNSCCGCCAGLSRAEAPLAGLSAPADEMSLRHAKIEAHSYTRWAYPSAVDHQDMFKGPFREALGFVLLQGDGDSAAGEDEDPQWMTCSIWRDRQVHSYDISVKRGMYIVTSDSLVDAARKEVVGFEPAITTTAETSTAVVNNNTTTATAMEAATGAKSERIKASRTKTSRTKRHHNKPCSFSSSKEARSRDYHSNKASRSKTPRHRTATEITTATSRAATTTTTSSFLPAIPEEPASPMALWEMMAANYAAAGGDPSTLRYLGFRGMRDKGFRCSIWQEYEAQQLGHGSTAASSSDKIRTMPGAQGWNRLLESNPYLQDLITKTNDELPVERRRIIAIVTMLPARSWTSNGFYDMVVELSGDDEYEDLVLYRGRRGKDNDDDDEEDDDQVVYKGRKVK